MNKLQIESLESKIAFLERHVEEQDKVILSIRRIIDELQAEIGRLRAAINDEGGANNALSNDEKPPHY